MKIEKYNLKDIYPYENNPRHNDSAVDKVAKSIEQFGWTQPIVVDENRIIIAGHTRYKAALKLGMEMVPAYMAVGLKPEEVKALRIADNRIGEEATWDLDLLSLELQELKDIDYDLSLTGFDDDEISDMLEEDEHDGNKEEDDIPQLVENPITVRGDIWLLGKHRLMCGDSTSVTDVEKLMAGKKSPLLHADPPYGMKKEKEGVINDNLKNEELDKFQMEWWATFRTFIEDNASAYIWGNASELWRLWYSGGLEKTNELRIVNEIVWAKVHAGSDEKFDAIGQRSDEMRQYPTCSERCLFLMLGNTSVNTNSDNYFEGWEPIRSYLADEIKASGLKPKDVEKLTDCQMYSHWFTKSQWLFISEHHYQTIHDATEGKHFQKPYKQLKSEYIKARKVFNGEGMSEFYNGRAYFDNAHDVMSDVWKFERVKGDERHGHATPKPIDLMERILKSSSKKNDIVIEPFAGSGSTLVACEKLGRQCYTMELSEKYCDVVIKRWEKFSGKKAIHEELALKFDEIENKRAN